MGLKDRLVFVAAVSGFIAVGLGAFGTHALETRISQADLAIWQTAVQYQAIHTLAMIAAAWAGRPLAARLFALGTAVFSGSLYLLVLTQVRWLGAVTPIGGVLFLAGWGVLATGSRKR